MVTKAIVEQIIDDYTIRVRIPLFDKIASDLTATRTADLSEATICFLANSYMGVSLGDIVYVSFEDNDRSKPVIIGHLSCNKDYESAASLVLHNLSIDSSCNLPANTLIGNIRYEQLLNAIQLQNNLNNLTNALRLQLIEQSKEIEQLKEQINNLIPNISSPDNYQGSEPAETPDNPIVENASYIEALLLKGDVI